MGERKINASELRVPEMTLRARTYHFCIFSQFTEPRRYVSHEYESEAVNDKSDWIHDLAYLAFPEGRRENGSSSISSISFRRWTRKIPSGSVTG